MANFNGMGPTNQGPLTGRGRGTCAPGINTVSKVGMGIGMGLGLAWGCKRRFNNQGNRGQGNFRSNRGYMPGFQNDEQSMEAYKNYLEKELEQVKAHINPQNEG